MSLSRTAQVRLAAKAMVRIDKVTGQPMLLFPEGALALNPTGAAIVELCDGRAFGKIVEELASRYNAPAETLGNQVEQYLGRLRERGLVEVSEGEAT
jgi:pyrroloquinoline quinone biosynthesis protein D